MIQEEDKKSFISYLKEESDNPEQRKCDYAINEGI